MLKLDLHLQIFEDVVRARHLGTGASFDTRAREPFSHPRALVGNFTAAQEAVKAAIGRVPGSSSWYRTLRVLVQPMARCEGGLTQIEHRVLRELAMGAGARKVVIWEGGPLDDDSIRRQLHGG